MAMTSRLLPSCFRRRTSPEEARGTDGRRPLEEEYKRLIAELRTPRSRARPDRKETRAYEAEKRQWIDEQKRLIAEAEQRAGGPDPRWNENDRRKPAIEERSAAEIKKMWWMAEHKRSIAEDRLRAAFEADLRAGKFHPRLSTETPASVDAEFLMKSGIQKNQWGGRRRSEEYYARRREVLRSFKFVSDESEKAGVGVGVAQPSASACATKGRNGMFSRSALGLALPAKSCCTG